ncbi:hypothetical protein A4G26_05105 [Mycobacterium kansasii]|nr:hypothetical protein A4G26_05105 [Mycobacterium kansasii]
MSPPARWDPSVSLCLVGKLIASLVQTGRGRVIALVLQLFLQVTLLVGSLPGVVGFGRRIRVLIHEKASSV